MRIDGTSTCSSDFEHCSINKLSDEHTVKKFEQHHAAHFSLEMCCKEVSISVVSNQVSGPSRQVPEAFDRTGS